MHDDYDIGVYCPKLPETVAERIRKHAKLFTDESDITCDKLIMIRMMDEIPVNVSFNQSIRMCHATKFKDDIRILDDCDELVHVSNASRKSFGSDGDIIYNPLIKHDEREALILASATRVPGLDKGDNARRMLKLAEMLCEADIPYLWFNFSDQPLKNAPPGFINVGYRQDIIPYIKRADYMVQLSDHEGFGYSILEALVNSTAVICTGFETTTELGVVDGYNGYIVPFDMEFDVKKLLNVPSAFEYDWYNDLIKDGWERIFMKKSKSNLVRVRVLKKFNDLILNKTMVPGRLMYMDKDRAEKGQEIGLVEMI